MTFFEQIKEIQRKNGSHLCLGLDIFSSDFKERDPLGFAQNVIDTTHPYVCVYKLKLSAFLSWGIEGLKLMQQITRRIPDNIPWILDGNFGEPPPSADTWAEFAFAIMNAGAVTANPYVGWDGIEPFVKDRGKYCFVLTMTSNATAEDFERVPKEFMLSLQVARKIRFWRKSFDNLGMVLGGLNEIEIIQALEENDGLVLLPGLGQQGGSVASLKRKPHYERFIVHVSKAVLFSDNILQSVREFYHLTSPDPHQY